MLQIRNYEWLFSTHPCSMFKHLQIHREKNRKSVLDNKQNESKFSYQIGNDTLVQLVALAENKNEK